ncbi:MAG: sulfatase activating formylglycine-generating enzyme [Planctomycetota bacterium]|jgi:formylglycine-generating enzyme required for sulfatase activity
MKNLKFGLLALLGALSSGSGLAQDVPPLSSVSSTGQGSALITPVRGQSPFEIDFAQTPEVAPDNAIILPVRARTSWPTAVPEPNVPVDVAGAAPLSTSRPARIWDQVYYDRNDQGIWSMGESYKALAHKDGFTFIPFLGSKAPQNYPVQFSLSSAILGGQPLEMGDAANLYREGDRVILDRGSVQVWYDMAIHSVEQSFALDVAGSTKDLVLNISVDTQLQPSELADGLTYRNVLGGVDYRHAIVVDGAGKTLELQIIPTTDGLSLTVPGSYLAQAISPVVVDPILSTYQIQTGLGRDQQAPDVAYDLSSNVFAYVQSSAFSATDSDVYIETYDSGNNTWRAGAWTDFTSQNWSNAAVANDNSTNTFLVACLGEDANGLDEIVGATHAASTLNRSPQFLIGDTLGLWENYSVDVAGNSVNTALFKVVWTRRFLSSGDTRIRSTTVVPPLLHSTTVPPSVGSLEAVTNTTGSDDSLPAISQSSGKANNAEWQLVYMRDDGFGNQVIGNVRYANDNTRLSSNANLAFVSGAAVRGLDVSEGLSDLTGANTGGPVYCLAASLFDGSHWSLWTMPLEANIVNTPFTLADREHRPSSDLAAFPAIASLADRFLISYIGTSSTAGGLRNLVTTLDYTPEGFFGVNERRVDVGSILGNAWRSGGAASRFSGGLYTSRYVGIAHKQENATIDIRAVTFTADLPHTPGVQYCTGTSNTTGDHGFITMFGIEDTQSSKTLLASNLPTGQLGYFIVGHGGTGQIMPPGSAGQLCIAGGIIGRYNQSGEYSSTGTSGSFSLSIDPTEMRSNNGNVAATAGSTYNFQAWHRENGGSSNFTNAISMMLQPTPGPIAGMVPIPSGSFDMGSSASTGVPYANGPEQQPVHNVTISQGFWMGSHEVTQAEYSALMGSNPSSFSGVNLPVEQVRWDDAMDYCTALTLQQLVLGNLPSGMEYRLPTEAEWEYACRAGTTTEFNVGPGLFCPDARFSFSQHSLTSCVTSAAPNTVPVGSYPANGFGLFDMHGNVLEWCLDSFSAYSPGALVDPFVTGGSVRVLRGGSWQSSSDTARSAYRLRYLIPGQTNASTGFRIVLAGILIP